MRSGRLSREPCHLHDSGSGRGSCGGMSQFGIEPSLVRPAWFGRDLGRPIMRSGRQAIRQLEFKGLAVGVELRIAHERRTALY